MVFVNSKRSYCHSIVVPAAIVPEQVIKEQTSGLAEVNAGAAVSPTARSSREQPLFRPQPAPLSTSTALDLLFALRYILRIYFARSESIRFRQFLAAPDVASPAARPLLLSRRKPSTASPQSINSYLAQRCRSTQS